jgi:hypothetical protein
MWRCSWLLIVVLAAILPAHADADTAYVPNEKGNTNSVGEQRWDVFIAAP